MVNSYQDLIVWQKSIDLVEEVYSLVRSLPKEELFALSDQMRRAAVSIPSNIAEGQQRLSKNEFKNFLSIAKASNAELQTQMIICIRLGYISQKKIAQAQALSEEVGKMLSTLIKKLSSAD